MDSIVLVLEGLAILAFFFGPSIVLWLKGKRLWATLGFITAWHWIPAFRLAKPDSWWAQRYYDEPKLLIAHARFAGASTAMPDAPGAASVAEFSADEIAFQDKTTRRAWEKARKRNA
jgi:hypothetical protein